MSSTARFGWATTKTAASISPSQSARGTSGIARSATQPKASSLQPSSSHQRAHRRTPARSRRPEADALPLQVGEGADPGVGPRHHRERLAEEARDRAQLPVRPGLRGRRRAVRRVELPVRLHDGEGPRPAPHVAQVLDRPVRGFRDAAQAGIPAPLVDQPADGAARQVVDPGLAAGADRHQRRLKRPRRQGERQHQRQGQAHARPRPPRTSRRASILPERLARPPPSTKSSAAAPPSPTRSAGASLRAGTVASGPRRSFGPASRTAALEQSLSLRSIDRRGSIQGCRQQGSKRCDPAGRQC